MDIKILTNSNISEVTEASTERIYVVTEDIDLGNIIHTFPGRSILKFHDGAKMSNGTIEGNVQVVVDGLVQIFSNVTVPELLNYEVPIEWFGGECYPDLDQLGENGIVDTSTTLSNAVFSNRSRKILFQGGCYVLKNTVTIGKSGITLSGTTSYNRIWQHIRTSQNLTNDNTNSVSTLYFNPCSGNTMFNVNVDGVRFENLLFHDSEMGAYTAIEMKDKCINIYAERCLFNRWRKGIVRHKDGQTETGMSRCVFNECSFFLIKETAIEVTPDATLSSNDKFYITSNIIRDSYFTSCLQAIRYVSNALIEDNSFENCIIDHIGYNCYDKSLYENIGCAAIYIESTHTNQNYATNNISRCYFEDILVYKKKDEDDTVGTNEIALFAPVGDNGSETTIIVPVDTASNPKFAAIICKNSSITLDNNFFGAVPKYFIIDEYASISINDNSFGINHDWIANFVNSGSPVPNDRTVLVEVVQNSQVSRTGIYFNTIQYNNAVPLCRDGAQSFVRKLVKFASGTSDRFRVVNYYESKFEDYGPVIYRNIASMPMARNASIFQVDYDASRGSAYYNYHPFKFYIYLQYTVYSDVYEVIIDMFNLAGYANLVHDRTRTIYGNTGLVPSQNITIRLISKATGQFYIYISAPNMHPTFKFMLNSDDVKVWDVTDDSSVDVTGGNAVTVRKTFGLLADRPYLVANSKGFEYFDTTNNRKSIWNGSRWMAFKTTPDGAAITGTTSQRPTSQLTSADTGFMYYDTTLGRPIFWTGSAWVNAVGQSV